MSQQAKRAQFSLIAAILLILSCKKEEIVGLDPSRTSTKKTISVLIIGDGFSPQQENYFKGKFATAKVATDLLPNSVKATFIIKEHFEKNCSPAKSCLGIPYTPGNDCPFDFADTALEKIRKIGNYDYYLVIFGDDGAKGCAQGNIMMVQAQMDDYVVAHEMGHSLVGLYDEIGGTDAIDNGFTPLNCSDSPTKYPWMHCSDLGTARGCDHSNQLYRPDKECRMAAPALKTLCCRCDELVQAYFERPPKPLTSVFSTAFMSPSPKDSLTVTALVKSNGAITVLGVEDVAAREVDTPSVLSGTFLVVDKAVDAPDVREIVGVLPLARDTPLYEGETKRDIRFEARVYLENGDEKRMDVDAQIVRFTLAGIRKETYANQDLKLSLRQIPDTHRGQLLDIPIATALSTTKVKTDGIPLEQPLDKFYRRR